MPNLNLYLIEGYSDATKSTLLSHMTDAVVESLGVPRHSVRIFLIELAEKNVSVGGVLLSQLHEQKTPAPVYGGPTVQAMLIAGRTEQQKSALISSLSASIGEVLNMPNDPIRIIITDIPNTDFGMNGVTAKSLGR